MTRLIARGLIPLAGWGLALGLGSCAVFPAHAQAPAQAPAQASEPADITVTGEAHRKEAVAKLTRTVSQLHDGAMARFDDAVCISVSGFTDPYNQIFARRMVADAAQAGIAVAREGCHPNVLVLMTDHVQDGFRSLEHHSGFTTSIGLKDKEVQLLAQSPGPVYVMTFTEQASADGNHAQRGTLMQNDAPQLTIYSSSIINPPTREDIVAVLLVIDSKAAMGKTLAQLADYSALRSFADLKDTAPQTGEATMLSLFSDSAAPLELTSFDQAYLKGLYHGPAAMRTDTRMHEIVNAAMNNAGK